MCIYIYIYIHIHTYITYIHTDRQTYIHTYMHTYIHTCIHTHTYIRSCGPLLIQILYMTLHVVT